MRSQEYLENVLKRQDLKEDSEQLKNLRKHREEVDSILRDGFSAASPTIRYGGSKAKGTLILESYDLDVVFYVPHDNDQAGVTLKAIFNNVSGKLAEHYYVEPKTSAIRLRDKNDRTDFHVDVVPGRYVDDSKSDCFIYQNGGEKERLKTNLKTHIDHVKKSGVVPAIRLLKLWRVRRGLQVKQFVFELLVIDLLKGKEDSGLDIQLKHVWTRLKESEDPISVEDPANPTGNDLSDLLKLIWPELSARSRDTLDLLQESRWEAVFGPIAEDKKEDAKSDNLRRAAAAIIAPSKPWGI